MLVIAHRGASGYAPENTKAAFEMAFEMNADGLEVDLQLTKDNHIVVIHDWTLERTTNGTGEIKEKTLKELQELDAGSWFDEKFVGEKILTLSELLEIVPEDKILNLEIKSRYSKENEMEKIIIKELEAKKRNMDNIIISSFSHNILKKISNMNKNIKLGLLLAGEVIDIDKYVEMSGIDAYSLHPDRNFITEKTTKETKLKIYSWTVNEVKDTKEFMKYGLDGVITNYPDIMLREIK